MSVELKEESNSRSQTTKQAKPLELALYAVKLHRTFLGRSDSNIETALKTFDLTLPPLLFCLPPSDFLHR